MEGRRHVVEEPRIVDEHGRGSAGADFKASSRPFLGRRDELITIENHAAKHVRIVPAPLSKLDFICSIRRAERGGMRVFSPKGAGVILLVGALVVVGSLQLGRPTSHVQADTMSFWEAAGGGPLAAAGREKTHGPRRAPAAPPRGVRPADRA